MKKSAKRQNYKSSKIFVGKCFEEEFCGQKFSIIFATNAFLRLRTFDASHSFVFDARLKILLFIFNSKNLVRNYAPCYVVLVVTICQIAREIVGNLNKSGNNALAFQLHNFICNHTHKRGGLEIVDSMSKLSERISSNSSQGSSSPTAMSILSSTLFFMNILSHPFPRLSSNY